MSEPLSLIDGNEPQGLQEQELPGDTTLVDDQVESATSSTKDIPYTFAKRHGVVLKTILDTNEVTAFFRPGLTPILRLLFPWTLPPPRSTRTAATS